MPAGHGLQGAGRDQHPGAEPVRAHRRYRLPRLRRGHPRFLRSVALRADRDAMRLPALARSGSANTSANIRSIPTSSCSIRRATFSPVCDDRACRRRQAHDPIIRTAIETEGRPMSESFRATDLVAGGSATADLCLSASPTTTAAVLGRAVPLLPVEPTRRSLIFSISSAADDWTVVTMLDEAGVGDRQLRSDPYSRSGPSSRRSSMRNIGSSSSVRWNTSPPAGRRNPTRAMADSDGTATSWCRIQHAFNARALECAGDYRARRARTGSSTHPRCSPRSSAISRRRPEAHSAELNRSVWNGNVVARSASVAEAGTATFSKILLKKISDTGAQNQGRLRRSRSPTCTRRW